MMFYSTYRMCIEDTVSGMFDLVTSRSLYSLFHVFLIWYIIYLSTLANTFLHTDGKASVSFKNMFNSTNKPVAYSGLLEPWCDWSGWPWITISSRYRWSWSDTTLKDFKRERVTRTSGEVASISASNGRASRWTDWAVKNMIGMSMLYHVPVLESCLPSVQCTRSPHLLAHCITSRSVIPKISKHSWLHSAWRSSPSTDSGGCSSRIPVLARHGSTWPCTSPVPRSTSQQLSGNCCGSRQIHLGDSAFRDQKNAKWFQALEVLHCF